MMCGLLSNSTVWEFRLTFCFSDLGDLGRHRGVGAPPREKQKVRRNGASHGRGYHTNEESRRRSFQWCMNQAISSLFRVYHPLSVARSGNVHRGRRRSCGVMEGSNGRNSRTKQIERCAADQTKEHGIPRLFVGFLLTFVHYTWRNPLAKFAGECERGDDGKRPRHGKRQGRTSPNGLPSARMAALQKAGEQGSSPS